MISTGKGAKGEFGLDGIAVIVNDILVDDEEQLEDIVDHSPSLQVQFIFLQSKTASSFDAGDMSKFFQAVLDFFRPGCEFVQSDRVLEMQGARTKRSTEKHLISQKSRGLVTLDFMRPNLERPSLI
jgi:hypothetical protein